MRYFIILALLMIIVLTACGSNPSVINTNEEIDYSTACMNGNKDEDNPILVPVRISDYLPIYEDSDFRLTFQGRHLTLAAMNQQTGHPFTDIQTTFEDARMQVLYRLIRSLSPRVGDTPYHLPMWEDTRPRLRVGNNGDFFNIRFSQFTQHDGYHVAIVNIDGEVYYFTFCPMALVEAEIVTRPVALLLPFVLPAPFHHFMTNQPLLITAPPIESLSGSQLTSGDWLLLYQFGWHVSNFMWQGLRSPSGASFPAEHRLRERWEEYVLFEIAFIEPASGEATFFLSLFPCECCGEIWMFAHGYNFDHRNRLFHVSDYMFYKLNQLLLYR